MARTFEEILATFEDSALISQRTRTWRGKRVDRNGQVFDVLAEDESRDTIDVLDVAANRKAKWKRSRFLSRGLTVLAAKG